GTNTFTGAITVGPGGTLRFRNNENLGDAANTILLDGGTLQSQDMAPGLLGQGLAFIPRKISLTPNGGTIDVMANSNLVLAGVDALTGGNTLTKAGLGEFQFGNSNSFSGTIVAATNSNVIFLKGEAAPPNISWV